MSTPDAPRLISFGAAIREAFEEALARDPRVLLIGEGVPDPKAIFETTAGLRARFGPQRVFDMPLAENGMTGICIGAALMGMRPVMVHQRLDFALLALDQIINNAAKWHYMFDGKARVPLTVRLIVGRGWGQGPQHSQSLQALFAHIPGLRVVMPATAADAKGMMLAAIEDDGPVIYIEHRWLHPIVDQVDAGHAPRPLTGARILRDGRDLTIAAFSFMVMEALAAAQALALAGIEAEVIDLRAVAPLDAETVCASVARTGHLVIADTATAFCGASAELAAQVVERCFAQLRKPPLRIASPHHPVPTSHHLTDHYYPDSGTITRGALALLGREGEFDALAHALPERPRKDVPYREFKGPF